MSTRFEAVNSERAGRDGILGTNATLAGRFRINSLPSAGNYSAIVTRTIAFTGWSILVDDAGHLRIQLLNTAILSAAGPTALALNTWYYLWIRQVNAGPGTVFIYLDGNTSPELTSTTDFFNPGARLEFATAISAGTPRYFDCSLDGWKVWSSNLAASNAVIEDGSHKATTTAGLIGEYFFDGTDVTDHSGNGNDLTAVGTLSAGPDSPIDGAALTATQLDITIQPSAASTSALPLAQQPIIEVRDASNALVAASSVTVTASIGSGTGVLSGTTSVEAVGGVATFTDLVITGVSVDTLVFTSAGLAPDTSIPINVTVAVATKLGIATQPVGTLTGSPLSVQPVVQTQDPTGALISSTVNVTASIASGTGVLTGTTTVAAVGGVATFTDLVITGISVDTIIFTSASLIDVTSGPIDIVAPTANKLGIATQPSDSASGVVFGTQPVVQIQDILAHLFPGSTADVTVAIASGPGVLTGTKTVTAVGGVATFTNLVLTGMGVYSLIFTSPGLLSIVSPVFIVGSEFPSFTQLTATPRDVLGAVITGPAIVYSSSNPAVAIVNPAGGVFAVSPGTTNITAICGGKRSNICVITVV